MYNSYKFVNIKFYFLSSFDWFSGLPVSFVIGQRDNFGFSVMTLN